MRALPKLGVVAVMAIMAIMVTACATAPPVQPDSSGRTGMDRISPVRAADINTRLGVGYFERGDLQLAYEKLERAIEFDPSHVPAYLTLAMVQEQLGRSERARPLYRDAVRLAPEDGATLNSYAAFLCRHGEFEESEIYFDRASADPFYTTREVVYANAGACALDGGRPERAEQYLREALAINAEYPAALYHLARLYEQQDDAFRARAFLQRLEATAGEDPAALALGVRVERRLGNEQEAERYLQRLEQRFPDSAEAQATLRQTSQND